MTTATTQPNPAPAPDAQPVAAAEYGDDYSLKAALEYRAERDALLAALEAISHALHNTPCMSREAQEGFSYHTAENEHRVDLCRVILAAREEARAALALAKG